MAETGGIHQGDPVTTRRHLLALHESEHAELARHGALVGGADALLAAVVRAYLAAGEGQNRARSTTAQTVGD